MTFNLGDRIGDHEVVGILGTGGMGEVYKARNLISDRIEAIKVVLPELSGDPELADRFLREIKVLAGLDHPNIAPLRTAQRIDNQLVMVMELVEGEAIDAKLEHGPIPLPDALNYTAQVLAALSYAHERGVIHRDIKPGNLIVTEAGLLKVMDFGIAKAAGERKLTTTGKTLGSVYYMSPEQLRGAEIDLRADLYSLGVTLYEMVTGSRPFQGDSDYSIMSAHMEAQPVPPIEKDPRLPAALNEIILLAIGKDPGKRFQAASAFAAAIESVRKRVPGVATEAVQAPAPPPPPPGTQPSVAPPPPPAERSSRSGLYMALGAVVAVAVIVAGAITIPKWLGTQAEDSPNIVQQEITPEEPEDPRVALPPPVPEEPPLEESGIANVAPPAARPPAVKPPPAPASQPAEEPQRAPAKPLFDPAVRSAQQVQPVPTPTPVPAQPSAVDPAEEARAAVMAEARKFWPMMASRASAVSSSLEKLQEQQRRSGLGLRNDMASSWKRMQHHMDQLDAALAADDADAVKEHMDKAERELGILEKFLDSDLRQQTPRQLAVYVDQAEAPGLEFEGEFLDNAECEISGTLPAGPDGQDVDGLSFLGDCVEYPPTPDPRASYLLHVPQGLGDSRIAGILLKLSYSPIDPLPRGLIQVG